MHNPNRYGESGFSCHSPLALLKCSLTLSLIVTEKDCGDTFKDSRRKLCRKAKVLQYLLDEAPMIELKALEINLKNVRSFFLCIF